MPEFLTTLWDTAVFGAAANTEFILFQVPQGADATHIETFTNNRGPGAMQSGETFEIRKISVFPNITLLEANVGTWYLLSFLEVRLVDRTVFKAPLQLCIDATGWGGSDASTAAANQAHVGLLGDGFDLKDHTIKITQDTTFRVRVFQGTAAAASSNIIVALTGILTIPG